MKPGIPIRSEATTILLVVAALLVVEVAFRVAGDRLSGDVEQMEAIGGVVADLDASPGLHILFVGNSLIGRGLDPEALASALTEGVGREVDVAKIHPDGSSPTEWNYMLRQHVFRPGRLPDLMVIAFGPGHLFNRDASQVVLRLAAHHVADEDVPEVLRTDLTDFESRTQFVLARLSRAYALRDRVQPRVLDLLIPRYRDLAPMILLAPRPEGEGEGAGDGALAPGRWRTLDQIGRIVDRAKDEGVPVLFLAMPQVELWPLDPEVRAFFDGRDTPLLDFREELALPPDLFRDVEHMNEEGRERFTRTLAVEMLPLVRRIADGAAR